MTRRKIKYYYVWLNGHVRYQLVYFLFYQSDIEMNQAFRPKNLVF